MVLFNTFAVPVFDIAQIEMVWVSLALLAGCLAVTCLAIILLRPYVPSWFSYILGLMLLGMIGSELLDHPFLVIAYALIGSAPAFLADVYPFSEWSLTRIARWIQYSKRHRTHAMLQAIRSSARDELTVQEFEIMQKASEPARRWRRLNRFLINSLALLLTISYYAATVSKHGILNGAFMLSNLMIPLIMIIIGNPLAWIREMASDIAGTQPNPRGWFAQFCGWVLLLGLMLVGDYLIVDFLPAVKNLL